MTHNILSIGVLLFLSIGFFVGASNAFIFPELLQNLSSYVFNTFTSVCCCWIKELLAIFVVRKDYGWVGYDPVET